MPLPQTSPRLAPSKQRMVAELQMRLWKSSTRMCPAQPARIYATYLGGSAKDIGGADGSPQSG